MTNLSPMICRSQVIAATVSENLPFHCSSIPFYKLNVPTVDTVRYQFLCTALIRTQNPILMVGEVGIGKTLVIDSTLADFDKSEYNVLTVKMSAQVGMLLLIICQC